MGTLTDADRAQMKLAALCAWNTELRQDNVALSIYLAAAIGCIAGLFYARYL